MATGQGEGPMMWNQLGRNLNPFPKPLYNNEPAQRFRASSVGSDYGDEDMRIRSSSFDDEPVNPNALLGRPSTGGKRKRRRKRSSKRRKTSKKRRDRTHRKK